MEKTFQTGSFSFRLKFPEELVLPVDMEKFLVETDSADYTYIITAVDILPEAEGELIVDRVDLQVFHTKEGLESRRIGVKGEARPYAFYRETAQNRAEVFVGRWYLAEVEKYEVVFLSLLALERRLAEAFTSLYGQITMNRWDREGLVHSLDLLEQLAGKVPVYHLACDISEDAVKTLEQEIGTDSFESETYAAALHKNMIQKREKHA